MVTKQKKQGQQARRLRRVPTVKVALLGFGTVGSSVARVLAASKFPGVELTHIFNRNVERKRDFGGGEGCSGFGGLDREY